MTPAEATAEVFLTAFSTLRHDEQESFLAKLIKNRRIREDIIDLAIAENRKTESIKPFSSIVLEIKNKRNK